MRAERTVLLVEEAEADKQFPLYKFWKRHKKRIKSNLPFVCLALYSFAGAGMFYGIERALVDLNGERANATDGRGDLCIGSSGFWGALYYVNTLYTTIGYGNVRPCCALSQFLSVIYALLGVPLVLVNLDAIGKVFSHIVKRLYLWCSRRCSRVISRCGRSDSTRKQAMPLVVAANGGVDVNRNQQHEDVHDDADEDDNDDDLQNVPVLLGVLLTLMWILLCSLYFAVSEHWPYGQSVYFSFISLLTIGLGDVAPASFQYTLIMFIFLFVGLSLVSTTINIVQLNIEALISRIHIEVQKELQAKLEKSATGEYGEGLEDNETPQDVVDRILKKHGMSWLSSLINQKQMHQVTEEVTQKVSLQNVAIQATPLMRGAVVDATCSCLDSETNTDVQLLVDAEAYAVASLRSLVTSTADLLHADNKLCSTESLNRDTWRSLPCSPRTPVMFDTSTSPRTPVMFDTSTSPPMTSRGSAATSPVPTLCGGVSTSVQAALLNFNGIEKATTCAPTQAVRATQWDNELRLQRNAITQTVDERPITEDACVECRPSPRTVGVQVAQGGRLPWRN